VFAIVCLKGLVSKTIYYVSNVMSNLLTYEYSQPWLSGLADGLFLRWLWSCWDWYELSMLSRRQ